MSIAPIGRSSFFNVTASSAPRTIAKLEALIFEELNAALKDGFTAEELEKAKSGLLQSRNQSRAQRGNIANAWVDKLYRDRTFDESAKYDAAIKALTVDAVNTAFRKFIDPKKISVVKAGDFANVAKSGAAPAK